MFQDEEGFGRINKVKRCWCKKGQRPSVPCHHIREYRYAYGAVEPMTGESFFLVIPYCNTKCMQLFLNRLHDEFPDDILVVVCDGAAWHKSSKLEVPENMTILHIPPYTPEMNPIEQILARTSHTRFPKRGLSHIGKGGEPPLRDDSPPFKKYNHQYYSSAMDLAHF